MTAHIEEPAEGTLIWKYLDLAKYLALLKSHCLHLAATTEFVDRYEGDIGTAQRRLLIEKHGRPVYDQAMRRIDTLRKRTYVSSWTENEFESDAMWRIYTGASYGVAVRTTYGRLKATLPRPEEGLVYYCGRVSYVNFKTHLLELDDYCLPYFYKRRTFEHEREVRVILQDTRPRAEGPGRKISLRPGQINELVMSVHLSPGAPLWFGELVRDVNKDYGLDRDPIPSALDEEPLSESFGDLEASP